MPICVDDVPWTEWSGVPTLRPALQAPELCASDEDDRIGIAIRQLLAGRTGDNVAFAAGCEVDHSFRNSRSRRFRHRMTGTRDPADVCAYPQSKNSASASTPLPETPIGFNTRR